MHDPKLEIKTINLPLTRKAVLSLKAGDLALINGRLITEGTSCINIYSMKDPPKNIYRSISRVLSSTIAAR